MDTKTVLTHLIKAGRDALHMEQSLKKLGYAETPYYDLYGEISEAIYCILGENSDTFDQSATYAAIHDYFMTDEQCAEYLTQMCEDTETEPLSCIPEATRRILIDAAKDRNMDLKKLTMIILSEWAIKEVLFSNAMQEK